jgi:hypothetical protein
MKLRLRIVSAEEREANPERIYLCVARGDNTNPRPTPAVLEFHDRTEWAWAPVQIIEMGIPRVVPE